MNFHDLGMKLKDLSSKTYVFVHFLDFFFLANIFPQPRARSTAQTAQTAQPAQAAQTA